MEHINWEDAVNMRRSVRSYEPRPVEEKTMESLKSFPAEMQVPFQHHVKICFFRTSPERRLYNNVKPSPPDAVAFITGTDIKSITAAGFVGEMMILYATGLGLSTCWFGHHSLAELERVMPHLGENAAQPIPNWGYGKGEVQGERAICISPLGYWKSDGLRFTDRLTASLMSYKRKPVGAFLEDGMKEEALPLNLLYAFDLARKAPSAANTQHWRFQVSPGFKTVRIAMPIGYRHIKWEHPDVDIGICACHFWLGLTLKNINCSVSFYEEEGRAVWEFRL